MFPKIVRIPFDDFRTAPPRVFHSGLEKRDAQSATPMPACHVEARYSPNGLNIHWLQNAGALQPNVNVAGSDGTPTDRFTGGISKHACRFSGRNDGLKGTLIRRSLILLKFCVTESPGH